MFLDDTVGVLCLFTSQVSGRVLHIHNLANPDSEDSTTDLDILKQKHANPQTLNHIALIEDDTLMPDPHHIFWIESPLIPLDQLLFTQKGSVGPLHLTLAIGDTFVPPSNLLQPTCVMP